MISLSVYRKYLEDAAKILSGFHGEISVTPVTCDENIKKNLSKIREGETSMFILPIAGAGAGGIDNYTTLSLGGVFILRKYNIQKIPAFDILEITQPIVQDFVRMLREERTNRPCSPMKVAPDTIQVQPETTEYASMAGWSVMFRIEE